MRVVLDTNIYISALMFGGLPGTLLNLAFLRSFETIVSAALLDELDEKLRVKFGVSAQDALLIRGRILEIAHLVKPEEKVHMIPEDPDDDRILECAVSGKADYIISGDRHLLALANYRGISILRVREFLDSMELNE